jgi:NAD(P)-dependent dehydrogenase (short-subunit alcohol dehydrogenase family)
MSAKGARVIVLVSRSGSLNEKVKETISDLAQDGTTVIVESCDITSQLSVEALVKEKMRDLAPVRGVIHGAMVLRVCFTAFQGWLMTDKLMVNN